MTVQTKTIGRMPTEHGEYVQGQAYGKKYIVTLFDCGWESKHENNTSAPATLNAQAGTITENTTDWKKKWGSYKQWLIDNGYQKMDASKVKDGNNTQHDINAAFANEIGSDSTPESIKGRVTNLEKAVGSGGSIDSRIAQAESEIIGDADSDYNTLGKTEDKIQEEATRAQAAEADRYTKSETYTKTEVNGLVDTPHQEYVTVDAYSNLPSTGSKDTIYRVSNYNGSTSQVDASVYSEYAWNGSQYIFLCVKSQIGEVFDISVYNNNAKYADLAAALNGGANIPQSLQKGGMSVKFVQSSDNKYMQYRLMSDTFSTTPSDWQGVDDEISAKSKNLAQSGAVDKAIFDKNNIVGIVENEYNQRIEYNDALEVGTRDQGADAPSVYRVRSSVYYPIVGEKMRVAFPNDTYRIELDFYSAASEDSYISAIGYITTDQLVNIPTNAKYVRLLFSPKSGVAIDYTYVGIPTDINIGVFIHSLETLSLFNKEETDIQNVNNKVIEIKNEFISNSILKGKYLNTYGALVDNALYCVTDFIELPSNCASIQWNVGVQPSDDIQLCGYNADKEKTNYWEIANVGTQRAINFTAGTYKYIRASFVLQKIGVAYIKDNTNNVNIYEPFKYAVAELYNKNSELGVSAIINLRLLSYNVRWLRGGAQDAGTAALTSEEKAQTMADFKTLFQKVKPDVFVCCENRKNFDDARVNGTLIEGSDSVYDGLYKHYFPHHTTLNDGYIPVIYSKYPILESGDVPITYPLGASEPNRKPPYIKISVLGKDVYIIGAHPKSNASAYELDRAPYFAGIVGFCADKDNVIVAGDFNTDTETPSDELDVFRNAGFELGNFGYFGQFATFRFGTDVYLDNVVTKSVINNNFTVGTEDYSDHYHVECEISV